MTEATAFIKAAGIADGTQKTAIRTLVLSLKTAGLWDKMEAIYPFVGGTADTHKWNLKNVSLHKIAWDGATHSASGVVFNAKSHNMNLGMSDISDIATSFNASLYVRNAVTNGAIDWGSYPDNGSTRLGAHIKHTDNITYYDHGGSYIPARLSGSITATKLISFNRLGTTQSVFRDGVKALTGNSTYLISMQMPLYLNSNPQNNTRQFAFVSFGAGLTDAEAATLNTIVQTYQTTLGRAV